ncbi:hypothetical protein [Variovorax sp. R-27]|jgi:hypothetical protein|uniref:hypothetical protein n=1 Tax=Variovorax sp. R-27 TaxID=3404058 RepID=UPI003CEBB15C
MTGFDVSSSERYSGPVLLRATLERGPEGSVELVERRIRVFLDAVDAGFFFPGRRLPSAPVELRAAGASVQAWLQVEELPVTALDVLGGMLADCRQHEVHFHAARAVLGQRELDLLSERGVRPAAPEEPPFEVEFPDDMGGNYALLVEIEFAQPVQPEVGQGLLETLALWDALTLAYPNDPDEAVEVSGAQAMFNDPRTIHYHEWIWDNADAEAWDLIINLCCAWHETLPIVRLHFE